MSKMVFAVLMVTAIVFGGLVTATLKLSNFAAQGARYTADDGALERAERIQADKELTARIDALHPPHWGHE